MIPSTAPKLHQDFHTRPLARKPDANWTAAADAGGWPVGVGLRVTLGEKAPPTSCRLLLGRTKLEESAMITRNLLISAAAVAAALMAGYATAGEWNNNLCTSGKGVDRCSSEREMIGEATSVCLARAREAASGFGMSVDEKDVSVKLTKWDHESKKDPITQARSCTFSICFDCKAGTK